MRLTAFGDARKSPYRVYFWDEYLTGSSYRFDDLGRLLYFAAGSYIYTPVHNVDGTMDFSAKYKPDGMKTPSKSETPHDHYDESDACPQCSKAMYHLCGYGLPEFCDNIALSGLEAEEEGRVSANILCNNYITACAAATVTCGSVCAKGT